MKKYDYYMQRNLKTSMRLGEITPVYWKELLPEDIVKIDFKTISRMITPNVPSLDVPEFDIYSFFVPSRVVYQTIKGFDMNKFKKSFIQALNNSGITIDDIIARMRLFSNDPEIGITAFLFRNENKKYYVLADDIIKEGVNTFYIYNSNMSQFDKIVTLKNNVFDFKLIMKFLVVPSNVAEGNASFDSPIDWAKTYTNFLTFFGKDLFKSITGFELDGSSVSMHNKIIAVKLFYSHMSARIGRTELFEKFGLNYKELVAKYDYTNNVGVHLNAMLPLVYHRICDDFFRNTDIEKPLLTDILSRDIQVKNTAVVVNSDALMMLNSLRKAPRKSLFLNDLMINNPLSGSFDDQSTLNERLLTRLNYDVEIIKAKNKLQYANYADIIAKVYGNKFQDPNATRFISHFNYKQGIEAVYSTSTNEDTGTHLGDVGAKSVVYQETKNFVDFKTNEHGYLMILSVPRHKVHFVNGLNFADFGKVETSDIYSRVKQSKGYREVKVKELNMVEKFAQNGDKVLAFAPAFQDYRREHDVTAGVFLSQEFEYWHYGDFALYNNYSSTLLNTSENILMRTLTNAHLDSFFCEFQFEIHSNTIVPPISVLENETIDIV